MRRLQDVFYINANFEENYFEYYGKEFSEFIKNSPVPVENILMLDPMLYHEPINRDMFMSTLNSTAIAELGKQGAYELATFTGWTTEMKNLFPDVQRMKGQKYYIFRIMGHL